MNNSIFTRSKSLNPRQGDMVNKSVNSEVYKANDQSITIDRVVYRFKVILLGDIAVGKSSTLSRFVENAYTKEYRCNVGVDFKVKSLFIDEKRGADLQIWDTCGEERFRTITRQYYRETRGIILIFDLTNRTSFDNLDKWMEELNTHAPKDVSVILLGNKSDLNNERVTSYNEATNFALKHDIKYIEISAKTGNNVISVFESLTSTMITKEETRSSKPKKLNKITKSSNNTQTQSFILRENNKDQEKKGKCCS